MFAGRKLEPGVISKELKQFYLDVATSDRFRRKLLLANRVSIGPEVSVNDLLVELSGSNVLRIAKKLKSRIDPVDAGRYVFRHGAGTGYYWRITAEHELLHLAQFIRDPALRKIADEMSWVRRLPYEFVPGYLGSPAIHASIAMAASAVASPTLWFAGSLAVDLHRAYLGPDARRHW